MDQWRPTGLFHQHACSHTQGHYVQTTLYDSCQQQQNFYHVCVPMHHSHLRKHGADQYANPNPNLSYFSILNHLTMYVTMWSS